MMKSLEHRLVAFLLCMVSPLHLLLIPTNGSKTQHMKSIQSEINTSDEPFEVSVVLPCLDESETLADCIGDIRRALKTSDLRGEIIVSDNGSTDDSVAIAVAAGAKVVHAAPLGYGIALSTGIASATADIVVMGDADRSYDFGDLPQFVEKMRVGYDVVIGNRFSGGVAPGAMPWSHRWIGNPIGNFHCGLRAIGKAVFEHLQLSRPGMEFASEMIVRAQLAGLRIIEIPTTLRPDGRSRPPHLRSFSDGWQHLKFLLFFCPLWLFFIPGSFLLIVGMLLQIALALSGGLNLAGASLSINTSLASAAFIILGYQLVGSGIIVQNLGDSSGNLPSTPPSVRLKKSRIEYGLLLGLLLVVAGTGLFLTALAHWKTTEFGDLPSELTLGRVIPAVTLIIVGAQTAWLSLTIGAMQMFSGRPLRSSQTSQQEV